MEQDKRKKPYDQIEQDLKDAHELIAAIRNGDVDAILSATPRKSVYLLERIEFVEERNRLMREIQDGNETLLREIQNRKRVEKELRVTLDKLEESLKLKDTFLSLVSHDIRSPLSTMNGLLKQLLKNGEGRLGDDELSIVSRTVESGGNIMKMVEDLIELSRFKAGRLRAKFAFIDVYLITVKAFQNLSSNATDKGVVLRNTIPAKTIVYADETMLYEVLYNLVGNAIKFSRQQDTVTIHLAESGEPVTIAISDTGVGISRQKLEHLFSYEYNTSTTGTGGEVGSGLGLFLCKEIIETHGGSIRVESSPEQGSTFYLHIPATYPVVFVVDNDHNAVLLVEKLFRGLNVNLVECPNGKEALLMAQKTTPHLILLDLKMDEMDGYEFLKQKKKDDSIKNVPTIVITMLGDMNHKEKALRLGADDFISKSTIQDELIPRVAKHIGYWPHFFPDSLSAMPARRPQLKRILLLEDDAATREGMVEFFNDNGYSIVTATSEDEAIDIYTENFREIDAMVVDLRLPYVDGVKLAKYNFENGYLPFVLFTSLTDSKLALQMLNYGVKDFLVKPVDFNEFLDVVNVAVARSQIIHGVDVTVKYPGNVESITVPSKLAEIEKAVDWIRRKIAHIGTKQQRSQFLGNVTEFILNAYEHGSLKISEQQKIEFLENGTFNNELDLREVSCDASIHIILSVLKSDVAACIMDEGDGFDYNKYLKMSEEAILNRVLLPSGRGIITANRYFDTVEFSKSGASVLLTKSF